MNVSMSCAEPPVDLSTVGEGNPEGSTGAVAVADLDKDQDLEIAFLTRKRFWIFEHDGTKKLASPPGFPFADAGAGLQTPAIGDVNRDGVLEVVFALKGVGGIFLHALPGTAPEYPGGTRGGFALRPCSSGFVPRHPR